MKICRAGSIVLLIALVAASAATRVEAQSGTPFTHENTPENLQAYMELIGRKLQSESSAREGLALFRSLLPDEPRLRRGLKDDVDAAAVAKILAYYKDLLERTKNDGPSEFVKPGQTVVRVRSATTEQLAAYREGSVAYDEFPGGAKGIAEQLLRPRMTVYAVEFLRPGERAGMAYYLFYWDGKRWSMLGALWRVFRASEAAATPVQAPPGTSFTQANTPENLQAYMEYLGRKLQAENSASEGVALFRSLLPDELRLRRALKDDVDATAVLKLLADYKAMLERARNAAASDLVLPEQTVVRVSSATTEQIAAYEKGSVAYQTFPGGAKKVAEQLLRPRMTFYEVNFRKPGASAGRTFHLFYWDGKGWAMLGLPD